MSKDVVTIVGLVVSFYAFSLFVGRFIESMKLLYSNQIYRVAQLDALVPGEIMKMFTEFLTAFATGILPAMLLAGLAGLLASTAQTRFLFAYENIKFKMERIDPLKGFKRLFSLRALVELLKSIIKITLLTWLLYKNIRETVAYLPGMIDWEIPQAVSFVGEEIISLVVSVAIAFGAVAALDYIYQRWEYEKGIRMTKQEVKDEYKQMEGSPEVKSARRQKQREFAQKRMMQQVKDADVIVRNPTHFAVALKYTLDVDPAPVLLAKGADKVAQRIVEEGEKHGIVTVEDKPLARGLYESVDILEYIPAEFFQPVAELLAWMYNMKEKKNTPHQRQSDGGKG